ncbi:hypothetical protein, partial [Nonomuraea antimicrobica]|uniref:hypothetical protein n=1 Tax=Nonomuraea antimicrobica TaxID=561173 RepID=UPI0031EC89BC
EPPMLAEESAICIIKSETPHLAGSQINDIRPGAYGAGTSRRVQEIVDASNEQERERSRSDPARGGQLPKGSPLPYGRRPDAVLTTGVEERRYRLIVERRIRVVSIPGHPSARRLRPGTYIGLACGTEIHYAKVRRITGYPSAEALVKAESPRWIDPERTALQALGDCHQRFVSFKTRNPSVDVRGLLAVEIALQ